MVYQKMKWKEQWMNVKQVIIIYSIDKGKIYTLGVFNRGGSIFLYDEVVKRGRKNFDHAHF